MEYSLVELLEMEVIETNPVYGDLKHETESTKIYVNQEEKKVYLEEYVDGFGWEIEESYDFEELEDEE